MAGDWIKFEHATPDKPEVIQMATILKLDQDAVVGKLLRLWIWADQQTINGNAPSVTESFLDRITFCPGFATALRTVGWLAGTDGALTLPNFAAHNGNTAKTRANTARRVSRSRKRNASTVTGGARDALPREEKRREERDIERVTNSVTDELPERDGPDGAFSLADEFQFVLEWNALADEFPALLVRHGSSELVKFDRDALAARWSGSWREDWPRFVERVRSGRVTKTAIGIRQVLQGDLMDREIAQDRASSDDRGSTRGNGRPKKKRKREATPERPHAEKDAAEIREMIELRETLIRRKESQAEMSSEELDLVTRAHAAVAELQAELDARRDEAVAVGGAA